MPSALDDAVPMCFVCPVGHDPADLTRMCVEVGSDQPVGHYATCGDTVDCVEDAARERRGPLVWCSRRRLRH